MNYTDTHQSSSTSIDEISQLRMNFQFTVDQLTADRDHWMSDSIEKGKQIEQKDRRIAQLEKDYLRTRNALTWTDLVISHPHIQQTRDRVLLCELTKRCNRVAPGPDGKYRASSSDLMASTSLKKDAVMAGMTSLKSMGVDIETESIPGKGNHKRYVYLISQEIKDDPRQSLKPEKGSWGGTREIVLCPNCGSSKNAHATRNKCTDCNHEWGQQWKANNLDAVSQMHDELKDTEPHRENFPTPVETKEQSSLFEEDTQPKEKAAPPPATCVVCGNPKNVWEPTFEYWHCGTSHK